MSYWNQVLIEVLNKHDPLYPAILTNVREFLKDEKFESSKIRKNTKRIRAPEHPAIKRTRVEGKIKKYWLGEKFPDIYFTRREAQAMFCFIRGNSTMQTAQLLKLSRRTVEFYTNNMKIKLNCRFKSELINKVTQSDFLKLIDVSLELFCK